MRKIHPRKMPPRHTKGRESRHSSPFQSCQDIGNAASVMASRMQCAVNNSNRRKISEFAISRSAGNGVFPSFCKRPLQRGATALKKDEDFSMMPGVFHLVVLESHPSHLFRSTDHVLVPLCYHNSEISPRVTDLAFQIDLLMYLSFHMALHATRDDTKEPNTSRII